MNVQLNTSASNSNLNIVNDSTPALDPIALAPFIFGPQEWKTHFDETIEDAPECTQALEPGKIRVLVPANLTTFKLFQLMYLKGIKIHHGAHYMLSETNSSSYWIDIPVKPFAVKNYASYSEMLAIVSELGGSLPTIKEALTAHSVYLVATKTFLNHDTILCDGKFQWPHDDQFWGREDALHYPLVGTFAVDYKQWEISTFPCYHYDIIHSFLKLAPIQRYT